MRVVMSSARMRLAVERSRMTAATPTTSRTVIHANAR
jgi:hypothetical protein